MSKIESSVQSTFSPTTLTGLNQLFLLSEVAMEENESGNSNLRHHDITNNPMKSTNSQGNHILLLNEDNDAISNEDLIDFSNVDSLLPRSISKSSSSTDDRAIYEFVSPTGITSQTSEGSHSPLTLACNPLQFPKHRDLHNGQLYLINSSKCRHNHMIAQVSGVFHDHCTVRVLKENPEDGYFDYVTSTSLSRQKLLYLRQEVVSHIQDRMQSQRKKPVIPTQLDNTPAALTLRNNWVSSQQWLVITNPRSKYDGVIAQVGGTYSAYGVWVHLYIKEDNGAFLKKSTNILLYQAREANEEEIADVKQWIVESIIQGGVKAEPVDNGIEDLTTVVEKMTKVEVMREWIDAKQFVIINKPSSIFEGCLAQVRYSERRRGRPMRNAPYGNAVAFSSDGKGGYAVTVVDVEPDSARIAHDDECILVKSWLAKSFPDVDYMGGTAGASEFSQFFRSSRIGASNQWTAQKRWVKIVNAKSKGFNGCIAQVIKKTKSSSGCVVANVYTEDPMNGLNVREALIYPIQCRPLTDEEIDEVKRWLGPLFPIESATPPEASEVSSEADYQSIHGKSKGKRPYNVDQYEDVLYHAAKRSKLLSADDDEVDEIERLPEDWHHNTDSV